MTREEIVKELIKRNIQISFAESCTGGALAREFTKVAGVSKIFKGSFVTYSREFKEKFLSVSPQTIDKFGIVSKEVALEMVSGLVKGKDLGLAVSTTGNAGPSKDDLDKSVGEIYVGFYFLGEYETMHLMIKKERNELIEDVVDFIFHKIEEKIS